MPRVIGAYELRMHLGRELDTLRDTEDALYVSGHGRLVGVLLDADHHAALLAQVEYLEDSLAALQARKERALTVPWAALND